MRFRIERITETNKFGEEKVTYVILCKHWFIPFFTRYYETCGDRIFDFEFDTRNQAADKITEIIRNRLKRAIKSRKREIVSEMHD